MRPVTGADVAAASRTEGEPWWRQRETTCAAGPPLEPDAIDMPRILATTIDELVDRLKPA